MYFMCKSTRMFYNVGAKLSGPICNYAINRVVSTKSNSLKSRTTLKFGLLGVTMGALVGTGYSIQRMNTSYNHIQDAQTAIAVLKEVPKIYPSKEIKIHTDQTGLKLTLYQYYTCPFCCKVRAFLDYYGISYNVVEVDPVLRQAIKWSPYKKVPILLVQLENGYQPLNDSSMIVSALASFLHDPTKDMMEIAKYYPFMSYRDQKGTEKKEIMNKYFLMLHTQRTKTKTIEDINEERYWRQWVDDVLVHTLSPNVYRSTGEALQAFEWFSTAGEWEKHFPAWERYLMIYVGASAMWLLGKRLKKRHNLKDDVRQSLYDECNNWAKAVRQKGTPFMGGKEPNLADLAAYGVLNSIEGCTAFGDALEYSTIKSWYGSMKEQVQSHRGSAFE